MKTVGLIAEYNPFHNGHQYHIKKAKELTGADRIIVIMSGNYVQRGTPAILPKEIRTQAALTCGASLVIELPVCYATGTAEQFAYGAVSILHRLGCVDAICFGSESDDTEAMQMLARILVKEPDEYKQLLQTYLREGLSFPASRQKAIAKLYPDERYQFLLEQPNNILGIEYLKALLRLNSNMEPFAVKRIESSYHDTTLSASYSSASAIRHTILDNEFDKLAVHVPEKVFHLYEVSYKKRYPIYANDFSLMLKYRLLNENKHSICQYADVSEELANRIYNSLNFFVSYDQFCEHLKTKEITYSRISRALLHILLGIRKEDYSDISYARMLGFKDEHTNLLTMLKKTSKIPLISKCQEDIPMLKKDIFASNLYESVITDRYKTPLKNEYEHPIIRI